MSELPVRTDILIVGAGPVGLALAAELRWLGTPSLLVDKQAEGANTSRAAVVHARTLEVLEPLGVVPEMIARGHVVPIFRVRDRDRVLIELDFRHLNTAFAYTLMCPQNVTEAILLARLRSLDGEVLRPRELTGLDADGDEFVARFGDGREVRAGWIVGCDGAHSFVRQAAGIELEGGSYEEDFVLADVRMDWPLGREEVSLFFSPAGLVVVAPLPDGMNRIVTTVTGEAPAAADAGYMQDILDARGPTQGNTRIREVVWSSRFHIQHRVAATLRAGRVLICGDAAHLHSPAGGQGMNTGVQDAIALAAPLTQALGGAEADALDAWSRRRREIAASVVRLTDHRTRAATLKSKPAEVARNLAIDVSRRGILMI